MNDLLKTLAQAQPAGTREFIDNLARTPQSQVVLFVAILTLARMAIYPYLKNTAPHLRTGLFPVARFFNEVMDAIIYAGIFVFLLIRPFAVQAFLVPSGSMWPTLRVNDYIVANKLIYRFTNPKFQDVVVFRPPVIAVYPDQKDANGDVKVDFVKRCIGLPGDLIEFKEGQLFRNGEKVNEPYIHNSTCVDPTPQATCQEYADLTPDQKANMSKASFKLVTYNGKVIPFNYTKFDGNSPRPQGTGSDVTPAYDSAPSFQIDDPAVQQQLMKAPAERIPAGSYLMIGDNRNQTFDGRGWGLINRDAIVGRSEFIWLPLSHWHSTR